MIEYCAAPTLALSEKKCCPFRSNFCFRQRRKSDRNFRNIVSINPSFHTLLKVFLYIFKNLLHFKNIVEQLKCFMDNSQSLLNTRAARSKSV